jgi:hypothetical protein
MGSMPLSTSSMPRLAMSMGSMPYRRARCPSSVDGLDALVDWARCPSNVDGRDALIDWARGPSNVDELNALSTGSKPWQCRWAGCPIDGLDALAMSMGLMPSSTGLNGPLIYLPACSRHPGKQTSIHKGFSLTYGWRLSMSGIASSVSLQRGPDGRIPVLSPPMRRLTDKT